MYSCPEEGCARSFKRAEHLSRHRLNHQPRKIYQCHICQKDFVRLDLMQRHKRRHDRGIPYRNSGGYSTRGSGNLIVSATSPTPPGRTESPAEPAELRGQQLPHQEEHDTTPVDQVPDVLVDALPQEPPDLSPIARHGTDEAQLTFFHGPNDVSGLTQDLNWLFGIGPWDVASDLHGANFHTNLIDPFTSRSPASDNSQPSAVGVTPLLPDTQSEVPRDKVLSALTTLPADILASSFFDASNLQWFMQSYWQNYNPHFHLLHRPTFSVQDAPPLLLVALLTLGATLAPDEEHYRTAEQIHHTLRWLIMTSPSFEVPAPLWVIQALLIVQAYEKMFSTRKLHEMSHIFHYSVITLMRRGSSYAQEHEENGDISTTDKRWRRWVERELSYRAAYFAFVMDAQHASIFGHSAALSLTDIQLPLPCSDVLWEAPTASSWSREHARGGQPVFFLPALRSLLDRQPVPPTYSPFTRFVLLHGLLCLTRHMITRDQTASWISAPDHNVSDADGGPADNVSDHDDWKDRLDRAIDTWSLSLLSRTPSLCLEAARPLQRIAHVCIHLTLLDFHILAGAPNLATGARARRGSVQFERAYLRVSEWANGPDAKRALSHCLLLVQETMFTRTRYVAWGDNIILKPWILYSTTLVLWAYGVITDVPDGSSESPEATPWTAEEYMAHVLNGLMGDGQVTHLRGASKTDGLIAAVRDALEGSRWELLGEAKDTLSRLPEQTAILRSMGRSHASLSEASRA